MQGKVDPDILSVDYNFSKDAGEMYVMQSTGTEIESADLVGLGDRLTLPEGWVFEVITLEEPLRVTVSDGDTIDVLADDLGNAYGYVGIDPLRYHDGYFVGDANIPGFPPGAARPTLSPTAARRYRLGPHPFG